MSASATLRSITGSQRCVLLAAHGGDPAVGDHGTAMDVARLVGHQEAHEPRDLLRLAEATDGDLALELLARALTRYDREEHRRRDVAGAHRVDADALGAEARRERTGEPDESVLRRRVRRDVA